MPRAVIFGATGFAGGHILLELLSRDFSVTAVSRSGQDSMEQPRVTWVQGSVLDASLVHQVSEGADVIISAVKMTDDARLASAVPHLLQAAETSGARLAFVGGSGTLLTGDGKITVLEQPTFPEAFKPQATQQAEVLDILRSYRGPANWFYLSPPAQFGAAFAGTKQGSYRKGKDHVLADSNGRSTISGSDYALALVDEICNPQHHNERFTVSYS
ncbi:NAD(P)H-binding protein [Arthrobacter sp. StoSoilB20]|uniref:NAD(P)-dependent oxidoreductase n=1 Tax=Arthrobacter sp. StoSoilB20 TaxID=2830995 RepID=UPI001CC59ED1|nr:NAD(P)H-binding protein [Arthrobacter sp. StoSoilB20]BCW58546.1 NAD-dependent epimerase [Arthrobacter sp. StoSoilB20]